MDIPDFLLRHQAIVEPALGEGGYGATYGPPTTVKCFADDKIRQVRAPNGDEVVSGATLYMRLDVDCPAGSRVTVNGDTSTVIAALRRDGGGLPVPDHLEVILE